MNHLKKGFTLVELLVTIGVLSILMGIVIVAINPGKQFGDANNAQRKTDVNTILNAVYQYSVDNQGALPSAITTTATDICVTGAASCTGLINLSVLTANEKYIVTIPKDPTASTATNTGYRISKTANNRVTVSAPNAQGETISVTR